MTRLGLSPIYRGGSRHPPFLELAIPEQQYLRAMCLQPITLSKRYSAGDYSTRLQSADSRAAAGTAESMTLGPNVQPDKQQLQFEMHRVQAFLAVVLAEIAGPLTSVQRDLLQSAATAVNRLERSGSGNIDCLN